MEEIRALGGRSDAEHLNLGPTYAFILLGLRVLRVLTSGAAAAELYVLLAAPSIVPLLIVRIFRVFFIFRPR